VSRRGGGRKRREGENETEIASGARGEKNERLGEIESERVRQIRGG